MPGRLSKLGRSGGKHGGSGAGGSRNRGSFPPPRKRIPSVASSGRIPKAAMEAEETFSLVPGKNPPAFAMIIRLAPGLVEEIRRLEEQGGTARIKFDALLKNTNGNVINVGGKEFKFTWSRELGALCDIYEECQSGEDGNRMLINSGCSWRKLNVQRVLDESTTNHVKMRSAEAARKAKSRKTITLDARSPSLMKELPLAETNTCRQMMSYKQRKEPPLKKRKVDPPQDKSLTRVILGLASTSAEKGNAQNQAKNNEISVSAERDSIEQINSAVGKKAEQRANFSGRPNDLQIMLTNLLKEAPMSLKALKKAVADVIPKPAKKIKKILGNIATFEAPGRYFLKPELDLQGVMKSFSGSMSSPEQNNPILPTSNQNHVQICRLHGDMETLLQDMLIQMDGIKKEIGGLNEKFDRLQGMMDKILTQMQQYGQSSVDKGKSIMVEDVVSQEVDSVDAIQRGGSEDYREGQKDSPVGAQQQQDREQLPISHSLRECRTDTTNDIVNLGDECRATILELGDGSGQKERETTLDEDESVYFQYEKEKPEPERPPIKDVPQYRECEQEFRDKHKIYSSLRMNCLRYSNEFEKLREDAVQFAKCRDRHRLEKAMKLFKKHLEGAEKHKRLKMIFVVLSEELRHLKQRIEDFASAHGTPKKKPSSTGIQDK